MGDESRLRPGFAVAFYALIAGVAWLWCHLAEAGGPFVVETTSLSPAEQAAIGAGAGLIIVLISTACSKRFAWAQRLNNEFRALLGPLTTTDIAVLAGASAIAEEMFFRGALQPALGLWPATLAFGIAHMPPRRELWPWSVWAGAAGLILGVLLQQTGSLLAPIVAHFTVNWFNLHSLQEEQDPKHELPGSPP